MKHKYIGRLIVLTLIILSCIAITIPISPAEAWTVTPTVRDFNSITEFREVTARLNTGLTFFGGDSVDHARLFTEILRAQGYDVSVSYLPWTRHLGILGFVDSPVYEGNKVLMFYDVTYKRGWTVYERNGTYYYPTDFSSGWETERITEPEWGKGGKPQPDKPKK